MPDRDQEQIELITDELADLDRQVEVGDLDEETADGLRSRYVAELDLLMEGRAESREQRAESPHESAVRKRFSLRAIVGVAIVAVAMSVIGVFAIKSLTGPPTAGIEGVAADVVASEGTVDLASITDEEMEAVVADNPDVINMRLALARRYFEAGTFDKALDHYMIILDQEKHPEALANVGWMTYISGRPDVALGYVEAALERQPGSLTATWFLGNIQFSLGNYEEAAEALTTITETEGVPEDVKEAANALLIEMEGG